MRQLHKSIQIRTRTTSNALKKNKKTFVHVSLRGTMWKLPSSSWATWHYGLFAMLLRGSDNSWPNTTLPAGTTDSTLEADLRLHLLLACLCWSTCSVLGLSESIRLIHLGTTTSVGTQSILNPSQLGLVWLIRQLHKYIQIWTRTTSNTDKEALKKTGKPLRISLYEALAEICLLQVEPLGTMQFLPGPCWDLRTVDEKQLFQERRLAQGFKQICSCICTLRPPAEAPALFCQNQSVKNTLRQR